MAPYACIATAHMLRLGPEVVQRLNECLPPPRANAGGLLQLISSSEQQASRHRAARVDQAREAAPAERAARIGSVEADRQRGRTRRQEPARNALQTATDFFGCAGLEKHQLVRPTLRHSTPSRHAHLNKFVE